MIAHLAQSLNSLGQRVRRCLPHRTPAPAPILPGPRPLPLALPHAPLPAFVETDPVAQAYRSLLGDLDWTHFPERSTDRPWPGKRPARRAPFVAAYLVKLHEGKRSMPALRAFLLKHPALVYLLGFPLVPEPTLPHGFDLAASVPTGRQFSRVLRDLSNDALQFLLDSSVSCIIAALPPELQERFGDVISGDTKHILAWVKENNPKAYIKEGRFDKERQPKGDKDCKLGVKRRRNRSPDADAAAAEVASAPATPAPATTTPATPPTPTSEAKPATQRAAADDIYWGYASGVVATKVPGWGEVVLAERTRPFNESDISYFFPLMADTERRLGRRPRYGAWDCAYDAHYVYDYFTAAGGFAAVPLNPGPRGNGRRFAQDGTPLCAAELPMTLQFTYQHRADLVAHTREKFRCPLLYPNATAACCPIADAHWDKGGCTTTIAQGPGSRIRHILDREGQEYKQVFKQRTATERINSQAVELGIERPKLRNQRSITNQNTLTYVLMNVRLLERIEQRSVATAHAEGGRTARA